MSEYGEKWNRSLLVSLSRIGRGKARQAGAFLIWVGKRGATRPDTAAYQSNHKPSPAKAKIKQVKRTVFIKISNQIVEMIS